MARSSLTSCSDQDSLRAIVQGHLEPEMGLGSAMAIKGKDLISQIIDITADGTTAVYSLPLLFTSAAKTRDHFLRRIMGLPCSLSDPFNVHQSAVLTWDIIWCDYLFSLI